ncbi:hypothetical protein R3P38DRAFT_2569854, partial [Favolaschia claudopus]
GLFKIYCYAAYSALLTQKEDFLAFYPTAFYPCEASVFSAATVELGGPHRNRSDWRGNIPPFEAAFWSIVTAAGTFRSLHGGHIILWDLGLVIQFPAGSSILIPTGIVRYSFVDVGPTEERYSIIQWAGSGVRRFVENGYKSDVEFAREASEEQHIMRENRRIDSHVQAADLFPLVRDVQEGVLTFEYPGINPPSLAAPQGYESDD